MKHALAALLVLAACGGDPRSEIDGGGDGAGDDGAGDDGAGDDGAGDDGAGDDVAEYTSGTRIRRRVGTTPDGAKMFIGWRDTTLNMDCSFSPDADGVQRCLPTSGASIALFFSDAQCITELAFIACAGAPAPQYGYKGASTTCGQAPRSSIHLIGARYTGPLYYGSSAQCGPYPGAPPPYSFFMVGAPVPATMFQSLTESVE